MDERIRTAIRNAVTTEPLALGLGLRLVSLDDGWSRVEMDYVPEKMDNMYNRAHGGAVFALIDEAFETASQTEGTIAVALNVNVTYVASPEPGARLAAEARRIAKTKRTATFDIRVVDDRDRTLAVCQALAFCTGKPIPFLPSE